MAVCSHCNGETPEGNAFCVNCGGKMPATANAQSTQFGMPLLRPSTASERAGGPATTQFGADELSALALAAKDAGLSPEAPEEPVKRSLMAGLPRPPVSSAPSPLTASTGLKAPISPRLPVPPLKVSPAAGQTSPQTPAARRTVMGMPLLGASAPPAAVVPEPNGVLVAPAVEPAGGASAILSMDSLVNDLLNPAPVAAPVEVAAPPQTAAAAAPPPARIIPTAVVESGRPSLTNRNATRDTAAVADPPAVRVSRAPLPSEDTQPTTPPSIVELALPKTSMLPFVIGVAVVIAVGVAIFLLKS